MSIPISQSIPPPHSPFCIHMFVLYVCASISALQISSPVSFFQIPHPSELSPSFVHLSGWTDPHSMAIHMQFQPPEFFFEYQLLTQRSAPVVAPRPRLRVHTWLALLSSWGSVGEEGLGWHHRLVSGGAPSAPSLIPELSHLSDHHSGRVWAQHSCGIHSQG